MLLNADGGTLRREGADVMRERVASAFAERGMAAEIALVGGGEIGREAERAAADAAAGAHDRRRFDAVVVGGGDGTVGTVAGALAGTGMPLGVLPLGTLNHFARDLGIAALDDAVDAIASGATRQVDIAEVNGRVFVNNSSVGVYPYMVVDRERRQEHFGRSKWAAMSLAFLRMLRRFPRRRLSICVEGAVHPCVSPCVFVGNNAYETDLFDFGKRAALDGGELCLYLAKATSPAGLVSLAFRAAFGGLDQAHDFETIKARTLEIRSRASRLPVSRDGEVEFLAPPLRYRIRPKALAVFAPAPDPAAPEPAG